ncbi:PLP-dependent aminotransferase family protein [Kribbella sandramycini]|uniref:GntR family transcriptional regulator/MocR family aminotransferase n=1 Tax=Kribbella sandramycini TaxID=60450 RepID=A0A7Y4NZ59_9ACTN|nr:PLP-dependent aminotransferase family protein [Kribbella sandramycini]MBB6564984.1 GntR family transcriptional regulator/MocR family aminotransferase [Kribbella sandramycini]NOL41256.1 PLP-dependent aminotransferase family protein [Kribbella sandramycini]
MSELHLIVDRSRGVRAGVERALRTAIRELPVGTRLPSSRALAIDLGVARNTVAEVYSQLVLEGYLSSERGAGTRTAAVAPAAAPASGGVGEAAVVHDLRPGRPDISSFPVPAWNAAVRRVLGSRRAEALQYDEPRGPAYARQVLAGYLYRARGVQAQPENIVLCSGFRQASALVAGAMARLGATSFGHEHPGQPAIPRQLQRAGLEARAIPVDACGAMVGELGDAAGVVLTPAHQFPTGVPLAPHRRTEVLAWARASGGFVLEDDYDGEFRYDRQPIGALQGLAPDVVAYAGSASKTLAPGLRLAWLVLPPRLVDAVIEEKTWSDRHSDSLSQMALAALIDSGAYDRHVRAARLRYRRRRDDLIRALGNHSVRGIAAGLQLTLDLPTVDEGSALELLGAHDIVTYGLSRFGAGLPPALVLGYGAPPQHAWSQALAALTAALAAGNL